MALPRELALGAVDGYGLGYRHMCNFMAMLWFRALDAYEYAMRVDEDVCLMHLPLDLPSMLGDAGIDYGFGLELPEGHQETLDTFNPWLRRHMGARAPRIPPLPSTSIYFSNFFVSRVGWWMSDEVTAFLQEVNGTAGVYLHRWGGAPRPEPAGQR